MPIRALVVDDTILFRTVVARALESCGVEVVASSPNASAALARIETAKPDAVFLDIEMPGMSGLELLRLLREKGSELPVVMVSALTTRGGELTVRALELGALGFVTKPEANFQGKGFDELASELKPLVAAIEAGVGRAAKGGRTVEAPSLPAADARPVVAAAAPVKAFPAPSGPAEIVVIGVSTGGPQALIRMVPDLPAWMDVPVVIVQHMPPLFTATLAKSLAKRSPFAVKEAENAEPLKPGTIYIAPGGRQCRVTLAADGLSKLLRVTDDPPENNCKPSADYLFRSAAHHYYGRLTAAVMTGMGADGKRGAELVKRAGGRVIAQDRDSCVVYGMPKEVVDAGLADQVCPLERLAGAIAATTARSGAARAARLPSADTDGAS